MIIKFENLIEEVTICFIFQVDFMIYLEFVCHTSLVQLTNFMTFSNLTGMWYCVDAPGQWGQY